MAKPENFLVSCDIGSSKVCVLIGEPNARGGLDILGKGSTTHRGARKGNIINVDSTVEAIKRSAEEAEIMAGAQITRAFAGLSGSAVRSFNSRGVVAFLGRAREISRYYIARVVETGTRDDPGWPLLYFRRRYLRIERAAATDLRGKPDRTR